jgi:ectoine hydroxylase-related dioxygenase (phytanoyl-CoA dioxygenase family)
MILFKDKINYKLPNGNGFHAHVDYHAYSHMGEISHLTANVAVDEATVANGCLQVVPGSHRMAIDFSNGGRISPEWENAHGWVQVPLSPGDVLLFGSQLAHRSAGNDTDESRTSLYATYYMAKDGEGLREKYYAHRRSVFPPDHGTLAWCFFFKSFIPSQRFLHLNR